MALSLAEHHEIHHAARKVSQQVGGSVQLMGLLRDWSHFIAECEKGYNYSADDYIDGLGARELLQEIIDHLSDHVADKLQPAVTQLDGRFEAATVAIAQPLYIVSDPPTPVEVMLYFRMPRKRGAWLEMGLRQIGILKH